MKLLRYLRYICGDWKVHLIGLSPTIVGFSVVILLDLLVSFGFLLGLTCAFLFILSLLWLVVYLVEKGLRKWVSNTIKEYEEFDA